MAVPEDAEDAYSTFKDAVEDACMRHVRRAGEAQQEAQELIKQGPPLASALAKYDEGGDAKLC